MRTVLADFLPDYDVNEVHSTLVAAPPAAVMDAVHAVTPREVPLLVALMAVRSLPALVSRRRPRLSGTILEGFTRGGFVVLRDEPYELVVGGVGRFWRPSGGLRRVDPEDFAGFAEPGYAKAAFTFALAERPGGTLLTTETRVAGTDERSRRSFRRYWRLIVPGSAAIRQDWLRAIRRRAERAQPGSSPRSARP